MAAHPDTSDDDDSPSGFLPGTGLLDRYRNKSPNVTEDDSDGVFGPGTGPLLKYKNTPSEGLDPDFKGEVGTPLDPAKIVGTAPPQRPQKKQEQQADNPAVRAQNQYDQTRAKYAQIEAELEKELARGQDTSGMPQSTAPTQQEYASYLQRFDAQQRKSLQQGALSYLAIGVPLALAFGLMTRGGVWAGLGALGQGMSALVKSHDDEANNQFDRFAKYANYARELSNDKMRQYEEILRERHTSTQDKIRNLSTLARLYGDDRAAGYKSYDEWLKGLKDKGILHGRYGKVTDSLLKTLNPQKAEEQRVQDILGNKPDQKDRDYRRHIMSKFGFDPWVSKEEYQRALKLQSPDDAAKEMGAGKSESTTKGREKAEEDSIDDTDKKDEKKDPAGIRPGTKPSPTPKPNDALKDSGIDPGGG